MRFGLVVVAVALVLGGCIQRERHERELVEAGPKEEAFCRSIGTAPGTPAYTDCRLKMRQELVRKQSAEVAAHRGGGVMCNTVSGIGTFCN